MSCTTFLRQLDGNLTLAENIADNGGVKEGFQSFLSHQNQTGPSGVLLGLNITAEQLYFLSYANVSAADQ